MLYLILTLPIFIVLLSSIVIIIRLKLYRPDGKYGRKGIFFSIMVGVLLISTCGAVSYLLSDLGIVSSLAGRSTPRPTPLAGQQPGQIPVIEVIVALQAIERGSVFVQGSIGPRSWPANNVPPDIIADETETIGKVARHHMVPGQVIVRDMLIDVGQLRFFPAPAVADGIAYFGRIDGILYALDSKTGQELWRFQVEQQVFSTPAVAEGNLYVVDGDGNLYALEAKTGQELWRIMSVNKKYKLEPASPIVVDGVVYFANRSDGYFYAVNAQTGQEIWRYNQVGTAIIADGRVYFMLGDKLSTMLDLKTGQAIDLQTDAEN